MHSLITVQFLSHSSTALVGLLQVRSVCFRHTTVCKTPLEGVSAHCTRHSQHTDIHTPGRIGTHNPSKWLATDPHLRPLAQLNWQFKLMVGLIKHTEPTIQCAKAWTYCNGKQTVQHRRKQKSQLLKGANPTEESISSSISQAGEYKHHVLPIAREATRMYWNLQHSWGFHGKTSKSLMVARFVHHKGLIFHYKTTLEQKPPKSTLRN
jgi:hypothetical protein